MCSTLIRETADQAHAKHSVSRAELLQSVAELESSGAWHGDGAGDLASWISARWQYSARSARELVRDARALVARPALSDALASGSISIDQYKALTVLCEEGTDDDEVWLEALPFWSLSDLEREARKKVAAELERRDDGVYLRMRHTRDERYMRGEFQLHPEDGAAVLGAIESRVPVGTALRDWDRASAFALVEMAKGGVVSGSADRPTVLLSVSRDALAGKPGSDTVASIGTGPSRGYVPIETARRLTCDARTQPLFLDDGTITGFARTSRDISPAMRRAVMERDGGVCTFPACGRAAFLECHHIIHVADQGPTELWNLQLVCWTHHTLLHEGGFSLGGEAGPNITWIRPDGSPLEPRVRVVLDTS